MKYSKLYIKTSKNIPADETAKNAQLLIQAGYVYKIMAGVYAYSPLGLRVLENIKQIVREEMNALDGQELIMSSLQNPETWKITTRWDDNVVDVWFKSQLKDESEVGFGWSHEEPIMEMLQHFITSYRDLPTSVYQFQTKLRNELRAKSGIMRGREFIMKDMYSLHASAEDLDIYYNSVIKAYKKVYDRLGLGDDTYITFASGGAFTKFSHEFQTICDAGEDTLYLHRGKNIAVNEEVLDEAVKELGINKNDLEKVKSAEVGNIFNFGTEKAEQMGITFTDKEGRQQPIYLASYGIGITRVMGVIVEKFTDERGIIWPENVAPYAVHLVSIRANEAAENLYKQLQGVGIEVLYDDREDVAPGAKFADADLIGIPVRLVVSQKTGDKIEWKKRTEKDAELITLEEILKRLKK